MEDKLISAINKYKNHCDYLEIRLEDYLNLSILLKDKNIESLKHSHEYGCSVRAAYKGGWSFCSFNNLDLLNDYIENCISYAKKTARVQTVLAPVPVINDYVKFELINDPGKKSLKEKIELLEVLPAVEP